MEEEIWKFWKETYNKSCGKRVYEVSDLGNVKINGKLLDISKYKPYTGGYIRFGSDYKLHRVVAELFIPNPDNKPCVDHIDGNKHNNRADNLRWVTHKENMNNSITRERINTSLNKPEVKEKLRLHMVGDKNPMKNEITKEKSRKSLIEYYKTHDGYWKGKELPEEMRNNMSISARNRNK